MQEYGSHKSWILRAIGLPVFIYLFFAIDSTHLGDRDAPLIVGIFSMVNFGVHELAHMFTSGLPQIMTAAAGSFSELLLSCTVIYAGLTTRSYYASALCCMWLMYSLRSAGQYMADANDKAIPLVSVASATTGGDTIHDWEFVFGRLGWLGACDFIGGIFIFLGWIAGIAGFVWALWLVIMIYRSKAAEGASHAPQLSETTTMQPQPSEKGRTLQSLYPTPKVPGYGAPASGEKSSDRH